MKTYDYLIIGGGIAGVTAAETIREHDASGTIAIISNEEHPLYSRVLLPSYLKKRIPREKVFLRNISDFNAKRIDVYLQETVAFVDTARTQIDCENGISFGYKKLLIASGGRVHKWEHGKTNGGIYRLQTLYDADKIMEILPRVYVPVVVGASFISLEFLEILTLQKKMPKVIVRGPHFLNWMLEKQGGDLLQENFRSKGITVMTNTAITKVLQFENSQLQIQLSSGKIMESDGIFLGIGLERNLKFLSGSGIEIGIRGVKTNEYLCTNIKDVFAAGDVAEYFDIIAKKYRSVGNWTNAFLQGKTVGLNMVGQHRIFSNVSAYSITNLGFQITALGEIDANLENVVRFDAEHNQYERFFIRGNTLQGAVLINRFLDKAALARLIEMQTTIREYKSRLSDMRFDIREIPGVK